MTRFWQITTTTSDRFTAERIATELVDRRLAACVQVSGPMESCCRWQGKIERSEEWVCTAKSAQDKFEEIAALISALHPYETPEVIATPIIAASNAYLLWLEQELGCCE